MREIKPYLNFLRTGNAFSIAIPVFPYMGNSKSIQVKAMKLRTQINLVILINLPRLSKTADMAMHLLTQLSLSLSNLLQECKNTNETTIKVKPYNNSVEKSITHPPLLSPSLYISER